MSNTYELLIYANWGMSTPDRISFGKDKGKAISTFNSTKLGGNGNIESIVLLRNGIRWRSKYLAK